MADKALSEQQISLTIMTDGTVIVPYQRNQTLLSTIFIKGWKTENSQTGSKNLLWPNWMAILFNNAKRKLEYLIITSVIECSVIDRQFQVTPSCGGTLKMVFN